MDQSTDLAARVRALAGELEDVANELRRRSGPPEEPDALEYAAHRIRRLLDGAR